MAKTNKPHWRRYEGLVQDERGRILGRYKSVGRDMLREEVECVKKFLIALKLKKQGKENVMAKAESRKQENRCFIAGEIFKSWSSEKYVKHVVTTGDKTSVPVLFFKKMVAPASEYGEGDYIQVVARASQSKDEESGRYQIILVGEEIKSKAPARSPQTRSVNAPADDEIPF